MDPSFKFKYVSSEHLGKVIQKVQQARKDQGDAERWQTLQLNTQRSNHTFNINQQVKEAQLSTTSGSSSGSSEDSSYDGRSSFSDRSDSDAPFALAADWNKQTTVRVKSKAAKETTKPVPQLKPKFDHQFTIIGIQKSQEAVFCLLQQILEQLRSYNGGSAVPVSPRTEERRKIRLAEFHARMKRNYVYTLQILVDKLNVLVQSRQFEVARNTSKQTALRIISKVFCTSFQALQVYRNQTAARRDCLATLSVLKSTLDLLAKVDDSCALFEVDHKDLSKLQTLLAEEMRPAFVEAESVELESQQPAKSTKAPIQTKARKMVRQKPIITAMKPAKRVASQTSIQPSQQDAFTETEKFVPLKELGYQIKAMQKKPVNVRFLMMEHEGADGSVTANTQTAPEEIESGDKATQTTEQAVMLDEAQSCRMEELLGSTFEQHLEDGTDYLTEVIEQVIKQEFFYNGVL